MSPYTYPAQAPGIIKLDIPALTSSKYQQRQVLMATISCTMEPKVNGSHCSILRLPEEVLSAILGLVVAKEPTFGSILPKTAIRLSNTCQRFRNTLLPDIYSTFRIPRKPLPESNEQTEELENSTYRLHKMLRDNPELRRYCKTVWIDFGGPCSSSRTLVHPELFSQIISDVFNWFGNTKQLKIEGEYKTDRDWYSYYLVALISTALRSFPKLTTLCVQGTVYLSSIMSSMRDVGISHPNFSALQMVEVSSHDSEQWGNLRVRTHGTLVEFH